MPRIDTWLECDLQHPVQVKVLNGYVFSQDNMANKIGVIVTDDGEPVTLTGTVYGYIIRSDGHTIEVAGNIEDTNRAYFIMPQEGYLVGNVSIVIKVINASEITTLAACTSYVYESRTGQEYVPTGTPIPDLSTLQEAINNANTAASAANTAATNANAIAQTVVAPEFSSSNAYSVGQYVMKSGTLYRFTSAHTAGNAWSSSEVTAVKLANDTSDLKSALNRTAVNYISYGDIALKHGLSSTTGELTDSNTVFTTDFIPVNGLDFVYVVNGGRYWFYDSSKAALSGQTGNAANLTPIYEDLKRIAVPSGAYYFRIVNTLTNIDVSKVYLENNVLENFRLSKIPLEKLEFTITDGKAIKSTDGAEVSNVSALSATNYISCAGFSAIIFIRKNTAGENTNGFGCAFYDSSKTFISDSGSADTGGNVETSTFVVDQIKVPQTAVYFRATYYNSSYVASLNVPDFNCYGSNEEENIFYELIRKQSARIDGIDDSIDLINGLIGTEYESKVIYFLGDSITRGMYTNIGDLSSHGPTQYNFAYWSSKIRNYTMTNLGVSSSGWIHLTDNALKVVTDNTFTDADYVVLAYGVNDYLFSETIGSIGDTSSSETIIGNMSAALELLIQKAPSAKIIVVLPMNGDRTTTGVPSVNSSGYYGTENTNGDTLEEVRTAIRNNARHYGVCVLDWNEIGVVNLKNIRTILGDGLHPTLDGYKRLGRAISPYLM